MPWCKKWTKRGPDNPMDKPYPCHVLMQEVPNQNTNTLIPIALPSNHYQQHLLKWTKTSWWSNLQSIPITFSTAHTQISKYQGKIPRYQVQCTNSNQSWLIIRWTSPAFQRGLLLVINTSEYTMCIVKAQRLLTAYLNLLLKCTHEFEILLWWYV